MMFGGGIPSSRHGISQGWLGGMSQWMPQRLGAQGMYTSTPIGGTLMSDRDSKQKIRELEDLTQRYEALLDTPAATAGVLEGTTANEYEYRDPSAPGAGPGKFAGPMSDELAGIPGAVQTGPDGMDRVDGQRVALATAPVVGEHERRINEMNARLDALLGHDEDRDPDRTLRRALGDYGE